MYSRSPRIPVTRTQAAARASAAGGVWRQAEADGRGRRGHYALCSRCTALLHRRSSAFIGVHRRSSAFIATHRIASHRIASHRTDSSAFIASHRIASQRIATHRNASQRNASQRIATQRIAPLLPRAPPHIVLLHTSRSSTHRAPPPPHTHCSRSLSCALTPRPRARDGVAVWRGDASDAADAR